MQAAQQCKQHSNAMQAVQQCNKQHGNASSSTAMQAAAPSYLILFWLLIFCACTSKHAQAVEYSYSAQVLLTSFSRQQSSVRFVTASNYAGVYYGKRCFACVQAACPRSDCTVLDALILVPSKDESGGGDRGGGGGADLGPATTSD